MMNRCGQIFLKRVTVLVAALFLLAMPLPSAALASANKNIRTANYFLKAGPDITPTVIQSLARFDLVILPAEAQIYNRPAFTKIRKLNSDIAILAYVPTKSISSLWSDPLHATLKAGVQASWKLRDANGNPLSVWPGTEAYNVSGPWASYLARFVHEHIMSTGLWDGIFYDEASASIAWLNGGNVDTNNDRVRDTAAEADTRWKQGMLLMLRATRAYEGDRAIIIINGDSEVAFTPLVNGRMFETFPTPWEAGGTWDGVMKNYLRLSGQVKQPRALVINGNTRNTGQQNQRAVRLSAASTLLGDGYWSFDFGDQDHGQTWQFDESAASLGAPTGRPVNTRAPANPAVIRSVWKRDFERGLALANSLPTPATVDLKGDFEKLRGTADPVVNNGAIIDEVTLSGEDGLILLRPLGTTPNARFRNNSFVRVFDTNGSAFRQGFFVRDAAVPAGSLVVERDFGTDGRKEKLVATGKVLKLLDSTGRPIWSMVPYPRATSFEFAVGDLDGDGKLEIVTAPGNGEPRIKVFNSKGKAVRSFLTFGATFKNGVSVAIAKRDIVVGAGPGGSPTVRIFTKNGVIKHQGFLAFDPRFRGGVRVAAGDVDNDGIEEIVAGAGPGGAPLVRVFDTSGHAKFGNGFFAFASTYQSGIEVSVSDVDGNGSNEIITSRAP